MSDYQQMCTRVCLQIEIKNLIRSQQVIVECVTVHSYGPEQKEGKQENKHGEETSKG